MNELITHEHTDAELIKYWDIDELRLHLIKTIIELDNDETIDDCLGMIETVIHLRKQCLNPPDTIQEKLLVIKNSYKKRFTIPCGRIKRGENKADAAVRELYEEVGIKLEKDQLTFVGEYAGKFKYATDIGTLFEITMAKLPQVQVDNREVVWAHFMPLDQVLKLNLNPTVKTWLKHRLTTSDRQPRHRSTQ